MSCHVILLSRAHAQGGKVIGRVIVVCCRRCEHKNRHLSRPRQPEQLVSTTNQSNFWLQCALNRGTQSTSVTNSTFLLAIVAMPMDSAYTQCIMHTGVCF